MLAIKLRRIGKKRQPSYRIVAAEKRSKPHNRGVEDLGWLNPLLKKNEIKKERVLHWLKMGAQPTPTVHNLLAREGIITDKKIPVHKKAKQSKEGKATGEVKPAAAPAAGAEAKKEEVKI